MLGKVDSNGTLILKGNPDHPYTKGFLCHRVSRDLPKRLAHPQRVLHPLLRDEGNDWRQASWEEAMGFIIKKLEKYLAEQGPTTLCHWVGTGTLSATRGLLDRFFALLGPTSKASGSLCGGAGEVGQIADHNLRLVHDPLDLKNTKHVVLWGRNPAATGPHLLPFIQAVKKRGGTITVINSTPGETDKHADRIIRPRPTQDHFLALAALGHHLRENTLDREWTNRRCSGQEALFGWLQSQDLQSLGRLAGVSEEDVQWVTRCYGQGPVATFLGFGLQRHDHGDGVFRAVEALAACTGNMAIAGGGVNQAQNELRHFDESLFLSSYPFRH